MRKVGLVYSPVYLEHDMGPAHPESPARLKAIIRHLEETGLKEKLVDIEPSPSPVEWIEQIHAPEYIQFVKDICDAGGGLLDYGDTTACAKSYHAALTAAGAGLAAVDAVMDGKIGRAFCAVRPPGHHAERDRAMGFCLFNNIAIAAVYIQKKHKIERVLILDWDVHHGNGTEHTFCESSDVFYASIHQYPHYPGTGAARDCTGRGKRGFTLNVPLPAGSGDDAYIEALKEEILPRAREFKPGFVLISAGFDAHRMDPLAGMELTDDGYRGMTRMLCELAEETAGGRVVSFLEGGYDLSAMPRSVAAHIEELGR
ncbi:MAG: histone deacetylase [Candidatus Eisenbacteria sp.]|nr:histone deacetylase [Candidatus Eisenbacteria bacterium]